MATETKTFDIGPLGQMPSLRTYALISLGFAVEDIPAALATFERAANELSEAYPWMTGQVVYVPPPAELAGINNGTLTVVPYPEHEGSSKFLTVKDCKELCPSYEDIVKAGAPVFMLDGSILSPAFGFGATYPLDQGMPVVMMQANVLKGGIILTVAVGHNVCDGNSLGKVIAEFATLCRGDKLTEEDLKFGNADRSTIIPPLEPGMKLEDLESIRCPSQLGASQTPGHWPPAPPKGKEWKCYRITAEKAKALKQEASRAFLSGSPDPDVSYISTNDAITTLIWTRYAATLAKLQPTPNDDNTSPPPTTTLIRCINGRRKVQPPISGSYKGHMILLAHTPAPLTHALDRTHFSLNTIAARKSVLGVTDQTVRSFFQLLQDEPDTTTINYGAKVNPALDLMLTSFTAHETYRADFGRTLGSGFVDFVRRPMLAAVGCLCYLLPMSREGDVEFELNVSDEAFEALEMDEMWNEYVQVIG